MNTIPFVYGIRHAKHTLRADLVLDVPAACADRLKNGEVSLALIPLGAVPEIPGAHIVSDYCIGAVGPVRTVVLLSHSPIEKIRTVYLDFHSRTSVELVKILARDHWHIQPQWQPLEDYTKVGEQDDAGYVLIGDKVFGYEERFPYKYDLAQEWQQHTGLPFVFAVWVSRSEADPGLVALLDKALAEGLEHIPEAIAESSINQPYDTVYRYLSQNISFKLDDRKRKAMQLFLDRMKATQEIPDPG